MFSPDTLVWAEKLLYTYFTPDALPLVHMPHPPLRARPARAPRGPHVFETSLKPLLSPPLYLPPPPFASLATVWPTLHLAILLLFSSSHSSPILHTRPSPSPCARFLSLERAIARPIRVITHACIRLLAQTRAPLGTWSGTRPCRAPVLPCHTHWTPSFTHSSPHPTRLTQRVPLFISARRRARTCNGVLASGRASSLLPPVSVRYAFPISQQSPCKSL